ncbi:hypothetical protein KP509_09G022600 [Ceratopteris richardii]|nr:hypothetical protein KP509_09G022600 [Ceratopteris richardii]
MRLSSEFPPSTAWTYDVDRDAWLNLSLDFLQPHSPDFAYPVASDGGLICFGSGRDFITCNPITKSWRRLPYLSHTEQEFMEHSVQAFGLSYKPAADGYDFFVLNCSDSDRPSVVWLTRFCSLTCQWNSMPCFTLPDSYKLCRNSTISCNSILYTLWKKGQDMTIFAYGSDGWKELEVPECSSTLLRAYMLDFRGTLYMLGGVGAIWLEENVWVRPTTVRIWKLQGQNNAWTEITRMPAPILHDFCRRIDFDELQCWGKNGVLYMKSLASDILMYNLSVNQWSWTKEVPAFVETLALIFEPSLSASA